MRFRLLIVPSCLIALHAPTAVAVAPAARTPDAPMQQGAMSGMDMSGMKDMPGMVDGKGMRDMGNMSGGMGGMSMQGNVRNGEKIARGVCAGCHGPRGVSTSEDYPHLAGQNAMYIMSSLMAYRTRTRDLPAMNDVASRLSDQDIADVAAFYDSLTPRE